MTQFTDSRGQPVSGNNEAAVSACIAGIEGYNNWRLDTMGNLDRAIELATAAGARRAFPLPVSVASHCELMRAAAEGMQRKLEGVAIAKARVPVIHNVDVRTHRDEAEIRDLLVRQMWAPVRWTETIQFLIGEGVTHFVECGPGKVLTGLVKRIHRDSPCFALEDPEVLRATVSEYSI